jgi:hypothetical protein
MHTKKKKKIKDKLNKKKKEAKQNKTKHALGYSK